MMSMKGVMILFALFSLGNLRPGKNYLIETEDGGDDAGGVTGTKSKILDFQHQLPLYDNLLCRRHGKQRHGALFPLD